MYPSFSRNSPNYPTRPQKVMQPLTFPGDLLASGNDLYTEIQFVDYNVSMQMNSSLFSNARVFANPAGNGNIRLPIPRKLNDNTVLTWSDKDLASEVLGLAQSTGFGGLAGTAGALGSLGNLGGVAYGFTVNPFIFASFQRPNYKEHTLSWSFAPSNATESQTISSIINRFKAASLPINRTAWLEWPQIALVSFSPNNIFGNLMFKPAAILNVNVDYSGAGMPSFFKDTKAPTVINLNIQLKEIQFWDRADFGDVPNSAIFNFIDRIING